MFADVRKLEAKTVYVQYVDNFLNIDVQNVEDFSFSVIRFSRL